MRAQLAVLSAVVAVTISPEVERAPIHEETREPRHVALLIGIADYENFEGAEGPPGKTDLEGPPNDVRRMEASLRRWGFSDPSDVRILLDADASKEGMRRGFEWLRSRATDPGDVVLVFYSGHGSRAPDGAEGDEAQLAPGDTLDEALVPWDVERDGLHDPDQLVLDDEIRAWLAALGTRNVTLIVDACYSGTITRGASSLRVKGATPPSHRSPQGKATGYLEFPEHALITAARADQPAVEMPMGSDGLVFGVLTYHLTRALDGAGATVRYDEVMERVRRDVAGEAVGQTPQLEGEGGARLFRIRKDIPHRSYAVVTPISSNKYELDVGAIHGVRMSALYDVHPAMETRFRGVAISQLVVDSVGLDRAWGHALNESVTLPDGARATLARVPRGAARLDRIRVFGEPGAPPLDSLAFVEEVPDPSAAHARVRRENGTWKVFVGGLELEPLRDYPEWAVEDVVTGEGGVSPGYSDSAGALCFPLARAFAIESFRRIENPNAVLAVRVQVAPVGERPDDARVGPDTMAFDRPYDVWARADVPLDRDPVPLYVSAAVEGFAGRSGVFHPLPGRPNQPWTVERVGRWQRILSSVRITEPPFGPEFIKLVVDTDQFDLRPLVEAFPQCGIARGRGDDDRRDRWMSEIQPVTGWAAHRHGVVLLPPEGEY